MQAGGQSPAKADVDEVCVSQGRSLRFCQYSALVCTQFQNHPDAEMASYVTTAKSKLSKNWSCGTVRSHSIHSDIRAVCISQDTLHPQDLAFNITSPSDVQQS